MCALALVLLKHATAIGTHARPDKDKVTARRRRWREQGQWKMERTEKEALDVHQRDSG